MAAEKACLLARHTPIQFQLTVAGNRAGSYRLVMNITAWGNAYIYRNGLHKKGTQFFLMQKEYSRVGSTIPVGVEEFSAIICNLAAFMRKLSGTAKREVRTFDKRKIASAALQVEASFVGRMSEEKV